MTSFTRKLYEVSPAAAVQLRRENLHDYRYGKNVTLATFHPASHSIAAAPSFGTRSTPPVLPAYECWAPELGKPKQIVRAADSFAARQEYARHHQIGVTDCAARKMLSEAERIETALVRGAASQER